MTRRPRISAPPTRRRFTTPPRQPRRQFIVPADISGKSRRRFSLMLRAVYEYYG